jgi:hypothetical protein
MFTGKQRLTEACRGANRFKASCGCWDQTCKLNLKELELQEDYSINLVGRLDRAVGGVCCLAAFCRVALSCTHEAE